MWVFNASTALRITIGKRIQTPLWQRTQIPPMTKVLRYFFRYGASGCRLLNMML